MRVNFKQGSVYYYGIIKINHFFIRKNKRLNYYKPTYFTRIRSHIFHQYPFADCCKWGLVHLGSAMLFIISILFGPKKGAMAGAFGMALFDILSGWTLWAPFTFITRGLQGYIVGKIATMNGKNGGNIFITLELSLSRFHLCLAVIIFVNVFSMETGSFRLHRFQEISFKMQ